MARPRFTGLLAKEPGRGERPGRGLTARPFATAFGAAGGLGDVRLLLGEISAGREELELSRRLVLKGVALMALVALVALVTPKREDDF